MFVFESESHDSCVLSNIEANINPKFAVKILYIYTFVPAKGDTECQSADTLAEK